MQPYSSPDPASGGAVPGISDTDTLQILQDMLRAGFSSEAAAFFLIRHGDRLLDLASAGVVARAAGASDATFTQYGFVTLLRRLLSLRAPALASVHVIRSADDDAWQAFRSNPAKFLAEVDPATRARLWRLITPPASPQPTVVAAGIRKVFAP